MHRIQSNIIPERDGYDNLVEEAPESDRGADAEAGDNEVKVAVP